MPPHPMMPMAALYGMPGHPYGPAMSMPGGGEGRKANRSTHLYTPGGYSVPQSVISGATTVRRARSVAEMSGHGGSPGAPGHHGSLGGHGQGGGQVGQIASKSRQIPIFCISRSNQSHFTQAWPRWLSPTINTMDLLCLTIIGWSLARMGEEKDVILLIAVKIYFSIKTCRAPSKLPMRQRPPGHKASPPPAKKKSGLGCCSGHFVVIWIILGIVTFGVLLGVVLKFTVS